MTFENIPAELRALPQWVCWKLVPREGLKPTKLPVNPHTGDVADVTNPATWASFDTAVARSIQYSGIGFVFSVNDPYCGIDLDDTHGDNEAYARQIKVFNEFASYSELSPSGRGLHIIIKATLAGTGRKRAAIEIYDKERYFTFTGNVFSLNPIQERQELANMLYEQMGGAAKATVIGVDQPETQSDDEIIAVASHAANGEKFISLFAGHWDDYPSQSEADFALIDIIAHYTYNKAQIARLFAKSSLGQTPKDNYKHRSDRTAYVAYMVEKSFDRQLPPVDMDGLKIAMQKLKDKQEGLGKLSRNPSPPDGASQELEAPNAATEVAIPQSLLATSFPPGLVGEIAEFIYACAPRPVPQIALVGALGLMAGICGRAYNVGNSGLNQYFLLIADTGRGKEAIASGISKLMKAVLTVCPMASTFKGPTQIASPQALSKWFVKDPCFYSIVGEFGLMLKQMSDIKAPPHVTGLKAAMLNLYHKSGRSDTWGAMAYSKKDENTVEIQSPSFTLIGESTPLRFYENINEGVVLDGLLPRFTLFEYQGDQVPLNKERAKAEPTFALVQKLSEVCAHVLSLTQTMKTQDVGMTPDAEAILDKFEEYARHLINNRDPHTGHKLAKKPNSIVTELWNRAQIKASRLAAVIAVGVNYHNPIITADIAQAATDEIFWQTQNLKARFDRGEIGGGAVDAIASEDKQTEAMCKQISAFTRKKPTPSDQYRITNTMFDDMVFPFNSLLMRLQIYPAFKNDRRGASDAIRRSYQALIDNDDIREVPKQQMLEKYGKKCRAFMISNPARFLEAVED